MNHKARMLAAFRGEQIDRLPYVPRLDLWYLANHTCGTLPAQHAGRAMNEIARAEGWALYFRFADDQLDPAHARHDAAEVVRVRQGGKDSLRGGVDVEAAIDTDH